MNTCRPEYIEGFVKHCYEAGLDEEHTAALHHYAHTMELLETDANFRAGFETELSKQAGDSWNQTSSFFNPSPEEKGTAVGAIGGGIVGALKGAFRGAVKGGIKGHGGIRSLLGAGIGAVTGGLGGNYVGHNWMAHPGSGASPESVFIPPYMRGGGSDPSNANTNVFQDNTGAHGGEVSSHSTGGAGVRMDGDMSRVLTGQNDQVSAINKQMETSRTNAEAALRIPGLAGSTQARMLNKQIADLAEQKSKILYNSNGMIGGMRRDQNNSLESIDNAVSQNQRALHERSGRASGMDEWYRTHPNGGMLFNAFNWLTGADQRAARMLAEQQALEENNRMLGQQRSGISGMLPQQ